MPDIKRIVVKIPAFMQKAFSAYILLALVAIAFVAPFVDYTTKEYQANFGFIFLPIALVAGSCLFLALSRISLNPASARLGAFLATVVDDKHFNKLLIFLGAVLFASQLLITFGIYFTAGWDVAILTATDNRIPYEGYFSLYPNQIFLAGLFDGLAEIASFMGFSSTYHFLLLGSLLCTSISITLAGFVAKALFGKKWGLASFALMTMFIGWNPMCLVPYSDTYGMLCPSIVLFVYVCAKSKYVKCLTIPFFSYIGYCVKPTAIFILVAVIVVELCKALKGFELETQKRGLRSLLECTALVVASFALAFGLSSCVRDLVGIEPNEEACLSPLHFLMMGFNEERHGVWAEEDVAFSSSINNRRDRDVADYERWLGRVNEMGPWRVSKLMVKKSLMTFDSGVFSFLVEGGAFTSVHGRIPQLLQWYGIPADCIEGSTRTSSWAVLSQITWLIILIGIALLLFAKRISSPIKVMAISLLLLAVFLLLFECRARYLFLYAPYFVVLGMAGWKGFVEKRFPFSHGKESALADFQTATEL